MKQQPELNEHKKWLGYVKQVGLVVSPPALLAAQAHVNRNIVVEHRRFLSALEEVTIDPLQDPVPAITDLPAFLREVLGWRASDIAGAPGGDPLPDSTLEVVLHDYNETLRPTYAVRAAAPIAQDTVAQNTGAPRDTAGAATATDPDPSPWQMLIEELPAGTDLDALTHRARGDERRWQATPQARFERLLRERRVPIGLLCNGTELRLVYAPRGETSGYIAFVVQHMCEVSGRPIFAALHLLLEEYRLFAAPPEATLPAILAESRRYQNLVSTRLSQQVLNALYELLRGFQAADDQSHGELLADVLDEDPDHAYAGLLTVMMRLVFILYAEDRGLLATDAVYRDHYSVLGLFKRLRADAQRHPDTMDQRFSAWAQLLTLFRLIHDGASHGALRLPPREGHLFSPDRYNFLEGRPWRMVRVMGERIDPPRISDGVVYRVLQDLLILEGERISYRSLDVEQIGSVYETMMGFNLHVATGRSIALKPSKPHGAPTTIDLEALLQITPSKRAIWIRDRTEQKISGAALTALKAATTPEDVVAALVKKVSPTTPRIVPARAMILQPSDERRRSGSHYTPRELTEPIVRTTLTPVLEALGPHPKPEQILGLKVCDPAMGSGAFLVEACRQLAESLVDAWHRHDDLPVIPPDEDELLHARRRVAQRCLYGVDKNPLAADLAKLSLWLITLARDHAFTFLDHALRHGDSLVGLNETQVAAFHWAPEAYKPDLSSQWIGRKVEEAAKLRAEIQAAGDETNERALRLLLKEADDRLDDLRTVGDLVVAAFFYGENPREREENRTSLSTKVMSWLASREGIDELRGLAEDLREGQPPLPPFHWQIEFPEVFLGENPGFDAIVGNPPFLGGRRTTTVLGECYRDYLATLPETSSNADLCSYFFRRAFALLREKGAFGLIATNTIGQGDTRSTGLRWICSNGGTIYEATRRRKWPGLAAVVVSVVHVARGEETIKCRLDGRDVPKITAFLFHDGGHEDPITLSANAGKSFQGSVVLGMGFTFDDSDKKGVASSLETMERLIAKDPRNGERIFPYIGGSEVNTSPTHAHHRYVINFGGMNEVEARRWPDLMAIVEEKVWPEREKSKRKVYRNYWWQFAEKQPALKRAIEGLERVLVISQVTSHVQFAFQPSNRVFAHTLYAFPLDTCAAFCALQARPHEIWARFFGSSLEDRLRYTPSDCFETFPFPAGWQNHPVLEAAGEEYYQYRAELMKQNNEGLTKTYNRFHDPHERAPEIVKLRGLHATMDAAVLEAYGWSDIPKACDFLLDYEEPEENENDAEGARRRKKPWRYRWPDAVHDEVLARLLELNRQRAAEEQLSGQAAGERVNQKTQKKRARRKPKKLPKVAEGPLLFGDAEIDAD